jgi:predicted transglutaminase-like cysteine proteinase
MLCALLLGAQPVSGQESLYEPVFGPAHAPGGLFVFCLRYPAECVPTPMRPESIVLNEKNHALLQDINNFVNDTVVRESDMKHWGVEEQWNFAEDSRGDCEDFALKKQSLLLSLGFPRSALLLTVTKTRAGESHVVLTVWTDRGDWILDNRTRVIARWYETGYTYISRQSQWDRTKWDTLGRMETKNIMLSF